MRKYLLVCVLALCVLVGAALLLLSDNEKKSDPAIEVTNVNDDVSYVGFYYVDDTKVNYNVGIYKDQYALMPFINVLSSLGCKIEWVTEDNAIVTVDRKEYALDLEKLTFGFKGDDFNYLSAVYGKYGGVCRREADEIVVDSITLRCALQLIGKDVIISIDDGNVTIKTGKTEDGSVSLAD